MMNAVHIWNNPHSVYSTAIELAQAVFAGSLPGRGDPRPPSREPETNPERPGLFARLSRWLRNQRQRELEAYLGGSKDVYELERRMRDYERRVGYF
jgi:hypothetical protein